MALTCCVTLDEKGWISCLRLNWSWNLCSNIPTLESLQGCFKWVNPGWSFRLSSYFLHVLCGYRFALSLATGLNFVKQVARAWSVQWQVRHMIRPVSPFCGRVASWPLGRAVRNNLCVLLKLWCRGISEPLNTKENKCHSYGFTKAVRWLEYPMRRNKYSLSDSPGEPSHIHHQSNI